MSHFTSVDASPDPAVLVASLDRSAGWLAAMKAYVAATVATACPGGLVLDLGCGAGHDLRLLADAGLRAIGLDLSRVMVAEASRRVGSVTGLVQGDGVELPFADASFDACRTERVLQHVTGPGAMLAEVARVVRPGGLAAVFEPDWTSWRVDTTVTGAESIAAELHSIRQPAIGAQLPALVEEAGFRISDVVTEASVIYRLEDVPIGVETGLARAVDEGRVDTDLARRWLTEQHERDAAGTFRLHQAKVLVVAHRR